MASVRDRLEHRGERPYDEQDLSVIIHPNGTSMYCGDRQMCGALTRAVLEMTTDPHEGET